ncbi:Response regulator receiver domain-containing protein [Fodinibius salinus]|uniref:Response regulator receiver domain-containing protein n=1 Tax=Fodinibius salinus TaxID=860790 RepID=A0A5D3YHJ0_9BACT|nr:response regulator [Fodinibius salinus]TYP92794.1 Response regulator receiver domain-containing protein [Fodinibius salinus]
MSKKNVLIVEDESIISLLVERMVDNLGHTVVHKVTSGEEAIDAAEEHSPDIILMDIRLDGEINGIEATKIIREKHDISVIFVSGNTDMLKSADVDPSEYIEFLAKPVTLAELSDSFDLAS